MGVNDRSPYRHKGDRSYPTNAIINLKNDRFAPCFLHLRYCPNAPNSNRSPTGGSRSIIESNWMQALYEP